MLLASDFSDSRANSALPFTTTSRFECSAATAFSSLPADTSIIFVKAGCRIRPSKGREGSSNAETITDSRTFAAGSAGFCAEQKADNATRSLVGGTEVHAWGGGMVRARQYGSKRSDRRSGQLDRRQGKSLRGPTGVSPGVLESPEPASPERRKAGEIQWQQR